MTALEILDVIYNSLSSPPVAGVKTVFRPGRPVGPFSGNLPAIVITTGIIAERRTYVAGDTRERVIAAYVHVFTRDPLERAEVRSRGSYSQLYPILDEIANRLEAAGNLGGVVDELESVEISDTGPDHGRVSVMYRVRERSE
jgi:hypothetical protein